MALDTLEVFGTEYTGVAGFKATDDNSQTKTYIRPQGTISITNNGTGIDVSSYASADVAVSGGTPTLQTKTKTYTPTTSQQTETITADSGYDGLEEVDVTVLAVPTGVVEADDASGSDATIAYDSTHLYLSKNVTSTPLVTTAGYVTSGTPGTINISLAANINQRGNNDLSLTNNVVTAPSGYYPNNATMTLTGQTLPTTTSASATSGYTQKASIAAPPSDRYLNIPPGYLPNGAYYTLKAMPSGTAGTPTATKGNVSNNSVDVTPSVTNTTGYITGGTKTGTAVSVSASELVSGTLNVDSAGTKDVTNYASASIPSGTAGTPSASKGAVSNHSVSVTPSVTNSTGWITGSTKTGTAVSVTASELVSGSQTITDNGTGIDVTNLASVDVAIPFATIRSGSSDPSSSLGVNGDIYLKTGGGGGSLDLIGITVVNNTGESFISGYIQSDGTPQNSHTFASTTSITCYVPRASSYYKAVTPFCSLTHANGTIAPGIVASNNAYVCYSTDSTYVVLQPLNITGDGVTITLTRSS